MSENDRNGLRKTERSSRLLIYRQQRIPFKSVHPSPPRNQFQTNGKNARLRRSAIPMQIPENGLHSLGEHLRGSKKEYHRVLRSLIAYSLFANTKKAMMRRKEMFPIICHKKGAQMKNSKNSSKDPSLRSPLPRPGLRAVL